MHMDPPRGFEASPCLRMNLSSESQGCYSHSLPHAPRTTGTELGLTT
ncbi:rCG36157 [Rattus norvegicus]|uniref:RCG36157 n=1 Tax=Rattus norvegicus TaxID=10116 RepID=A6IKJ8_RAT|nr:rCG36157 [Rattus norvegicus]